MSNILHCLNSQNFDRNDFEIILVEDKGGSKAGVSFIEKFPDLNIFHFAPDKGWGRMGFMRNHGLSVSKGEVVLFFDDDTVINDHYFFEKLYKRFKSDQHLDAVLSKGEASYSIISGRYSYHDPFFFTNRCMAYRRSCIAKLNGFDSNFIGQEDVELAIRFIAKNYNSVEADNLLYYHPPLVYNDKGKGEAVGASFARSKYTFWIKILLFFNGVRWLPLYFRRGKKNKYMTRFAAGFAKGFIKEILNLNKKASYS